MIGDWIATSGVLALAVVVVFGPGLLVGAALGLRGLPLAAVAPGISTGLLAMLAIVFPLAGIRWDRLTVLVAVAVVLALALVVRRLLRSPAPRPVARGGRGGRVLLVAGLVVGGGLIAARLLTYIGLPGAISQTNDAVFHLNALRWIEQTGSASSLDITQVIGSTSFYPAAWHALASLVVVSPDGIPLAANMVALVIGALVWPLGAALVTRTVTGGDPLATALAAALSAGLLAFPQLMFEWGVLYPYALALALAPAAVAMTMLAAQRVTLGPAPLHGLGPATAAAVVLVGVALAQPSALLVWGLLVLLWVSEPLVARMRRSGAPTLRRRRSAALAFVGLWTVLGLAWLSLAYLAGPVHWDPYRSIPGGAADVLLNAQGALPPAIGMSILLAVGLVVAARTPRRRWLVAAWLVLALLYIVAVATNLPIVKRVLTGPWYGDSYRLAAMFPIVVVPLAAIGLAAVLTWFVRSIASARAERWAGPAAIAVVALVGAVGVALVPVVQLQVADDRDEQSRYALNDDSYLSLDAYGLLARLPELVPDDALLIGNPSTGVGFAYALGERAVVPATWTPPVSSAWDLLAEGLHDAAAEPEVCDALALYGDPGYVLDFGRGETTPGRYVMPGMTGFAGREGFDLVDREGTASLWRITACR